MNHENRLSRPRRNFIIGELYLAGYSNENIHQFMGEEQLSTRSIQHVSSNFNYENTPKYERNRMIYDVSQDGVPIRDIYLFMGGPQLNLRSIQLITKKIWEEASKL